jgi:hypothetical protein
VATTTPNLGLVKPDYNDAADIGVINSNMDRIDTAHAAHLAKAVTAAGGVHGLAVETGTFTPYWTCDIGTYSGNTYSVQSGNYYLIGKLCHFNLRLTLTAKDPSMSGTIAIKGLPFLPNSADSARRFGASIIQAQLYDRDPDNPYLGAFINSAGELRPWRDGDSTQGGWDQSSSLTNTTSFILVGDYEIA